MLPLRPPPLLPKPPLQLPLLPLRQPRRPHRVERQLLNHLNRIAKRPRNCQPLVGKRGVEHRRVVDGPTAQRLAEDLLTLLERKVRTSSAAETINSVLRPT